MNGNLLDELNKIYKPLWDKSVEIKSTLTNLGFEVKSGFFNGHYVKMNDEYVVEHYPIPVIAIANIGEIEIDMDSLGVEITLSKDRALSLDYPSLAQNYKMEVYGAEKFLEDFYNEQEDPHEIVEKLKKSEELKICIAFNFKKDIALDEIVKLIQLFAA